MQPLLATVWHSGSNYVREEHKRNRNDVIFQHTGPELWQKMHRACDFTDRRIITTLRDPYLVGASWANRYDMNSPEYRWHWLVVWSGWERLLSYNPEIRLVSEFTGKVVRSVGDTKGAYEMLEYGDMTSYYNIMPEDLIEYALEIIKKAPVNTGAKFIGRIT